MTFYDEQVHKKQMESKNLQSHKVLMIDTYLTRSENWLQILNVMQSSILLTINEHKGNPKGSFTSTLTVIGMDFEAQYNRILNFVLPPAIPNSDSLAEIFVALDNFRRHNEKRVMACGNEPINWENLSRQFTSIFEILPKKANLQATILTNTVIPFDIEKLFGLNQFGSITLAYFYDELFTADDEQRFLQQPSVEILPRQMESLRIEKVRIQCVYSEIDAFFKSFVFEEWICKREAFQLSLPSSVFAKQNMILNCQAKPRFISPLSLPQGILLSTATAYTGKMFSRKLQEHSPLIRLKAVCQIKVSGLCQSLFCSAQVFIVSPQPIKSVLGETDDKEALSSINIKNESRFNSMWKTLKRDNCGLLLIRSTTTGIKDFSDRHACLNGHFFLTPIRNDIFILQSVVTSELMLTPPNRFHNLKEHGGGLEDEITVMDIESSLGKLEVLEEYDPFDYECDLYKYLQGQYKTNSQKCKNTKPSSNKSVQRLSSLKQTNSKRMKYNPIV